MNATDSIPFFRPSFVALAMVEFLSNHSLSLDAKRLLLSLLLEGSTAVPLDDESAGKLRFLGIIRPVRPSNTGIRGGCPEGFYEVTLNEGFSARFSRYLEANARPEDKKTAADFVALAEWAIHATPGTSAPGINEAMELLS